MLKAEEHKEKVEDLETSATEIDLQPIPEALSKGPRVFSSSLNSHPARQNTSLADDAEEEAERNSSAINSQNNNDWPALSPSIGSKIVSSPSPRHKTTSKTAGHQAKATPFTARTDSYDIISTYPATSNAERHNVSPSTRQATIGKSGGRKWQPFSSGTENGDDDTQPAAGQYKTGIKAALPGYSKIEGKHYSPSATERVDRWKAERQSEAASSNGESCRNASKKRSHNTLIA